MGNANSSSSSSANNRPPPAAHHQSRRSRSAVPPVQSQQSDPLQPTTTTTNTQQQQQQIPSPSSDANGPSTHAVPVLLQSPTKDQRERDQDRDRDKDKDKDSSSNRDSRDRDRDRDRDRKPHRSLRTKKRSLELPDLALAITPASSPGHVAAMPHQHIQQGPYRRPQPSSPIAIPTRPGQQAGSGPAANYQRTTANPGAGLPTNYAYERERQLQQQQQQQQQTTDSQDQFVQGPAGSTPYARRGNPHIRGAPLQYNSTRSFANTHSQFVSQQNQQQQQQQQQQQTPHRDRDYHHHQSFVQRGHFQPEDVHSSLPLALRKAEIAQAHEYYGLEGEILQEGKVSIKRWSTEEKRPAQVKIVYHNASAKSVILIRAGDDNWTGRQPMDFDESTGEWSTWVSLMPGTHHIRFIVDGITSTSEELPTAVDDNGSLANYVAVPISGQTPPSATLHPTTRDYSPSHTTSNSISASANTGTGTGTGTGGGGGGGASFFADNVDPQNIPPEVGEWTDRVPWQLECAAEEEEAWLTTGQAARSQPPQHPQAPLLPRHLEKLIMNQRPPGMSRTATTGIAAHTTASSNVAAAKGAAAATALFNKNNGGGPTLPVTTASGTNLSASSSGNGSGTPASTDSSSVVSAPPVQVSLYTKLVDVAGQLADDGSVLPVPSHVVLHHLGTSAIRNGVLAVADTIRYRKKYITTIYYKPT